VLFFKESERLLSELEDLHERFDKSQLDVKNLTEEKERFEVEARKFRNQLDHARASLDQVDLKICVARRKIIFLRLYLMNF